MAAARLLCWAVCLSAYSYDIEFRPTSEHSNADSLSCLPLHSIRAQESLSDPAVFNMHQLESLPVTTGRLAQATRTDPVLSHVYSHTLQGWPQSVDDQFRPYFNRRDELTVESGCVLWDARVVIPDKYQEKLLNELHRDHPEIMKSVARSYFGALV